MEAEKKTGLRWRGAAAALMALLCLPAGFAAAADWPMFRGNAARTGFSAEQAAPPLTKAWEFQAGAGIVSSPAVFRGRAYIGSSDGRLYAFDAATGTQLWTYAAGGRVDSSPAAAGSAVYAVSSDGYLHAVNAVTGALIWKTPLGAYSISSPLELGGRLYVGTGAPERRLKVFDASSGAELGSYQAGQPVDSSPSTDGHRVYFGANDGKLYALDAFTLAAAWIYQATGGRYGLNAVPVSSGVVYAVPGYDETRPLALAAASGPLLLNSLNAPFEEDVLQPDGSIAWAQTASPVVSHDRLYFNGGSGANTLYGAHSVPVSQALAYIWQSSPTLGAVSPSGLLSSPAMANEMLYAGTVDGALVAFTSSAASVPLVADVAYSSPVYSSPAIANGMVFVADAGGRLYAYSAARAAAFSSPAPGAVVDGAVTLAGYVANPALTGYEITYSTGGSPEVWHAVLSSATVHAVTGGELAGWDVSALANGNYVLRLRVSESGAPAYDNTALLRLRVNAAPEAPSGLSAADNPGDAGNRINLSWTASVTPELAAYRVYRDGGDGFSLLGSAAGNAVSYADTAAVTGSTYSYVVRAWDGYSESGDSGQASAFSVNDTGDFTPPATVTDLSAEPSVSPGAVTLTWTAPGDDGLLGRASLFYIRHTTVAGYDWNSFDSGGLPVSTRPAEGAAGDNISAEISGLLGGVTYYFALKAADAVPNISAVSNAAAAYASPDYQAPAPPAALAAADTPGDDGGRLTLTWELSPDDASGGVYGYRIWRRGQSGTYGETPYATVAAGAASYTDPAALEGLRFYYQVAAFDSTNDSARSNEASAVSADNWRFFDAILGGSLRLEDGARVDIPGGAVSQNDSLLMVRLDPATYQPLAAVKAAAAANPTAIVYEVKFLSGATSLVGKAVLSLPYSDTEVAGMVQENLRIYTLSDGAWRMLDTSAADLQGRRVIAEVGRFSVFRVMEYVPSGSLLAKDEVYTYPNPAPGDTVTFKFRPADKAGVKIEVYNVAGQKVAQLEKTSCPAGVTSEIVWNVRNVASGVYVYRLRAESASGSRTLTKKLAIAH
jgi:outer membrane protein assembly factor BamB